MSSKPSNSFKLTLFNQGTNFSSMYDFPILSTGNGTVINGLIGAKLPDLRSKLFPPTSLKNAILKLADDQNNVALERLLQMVENGEIFDAIITVTNPTQLYGLLTHEEHRFIGATFVNIEHVEWSILKNNEYPSMLIRVIEMKYKNYSIKPIDLEPQLIEIVQPL